MTAANLPIPATAYLDGLIDQAAAQALIDQRPRRLNPITRRLLEWQVFFMLGNVRRARTRLAEHAAAAWLYKEEWRISRVLRPEAKTYGRLLAHRIAMMGMSHREVIDGRKRFTQRVRFDRYVMMSEVAFTYRILASRQSLLGTKSMLPYRTRIGELLEEENVKELSITCNRHVTTEFRSGRGLFIHVWRNEDMADLPKLVRWDDMLPEFQPGRPEICLGVSARRQIQMARLDKVPHVLVAGSTGSGKSVTLNNIICALIRFNTPAQIKLLLIDLKRVEFWDYFQTPPAPIPHLVKCTPDAASVVDTATEANRALKQVLALIKLRYNILQGVARNIDEYNKSHAEQIPRLIVIIDELAELMLDTDSKRASEAERLLIRIAQLGRAAGVHLICCTQRPSKEVVTTNLTAQLDLRISGRMAQQWDSVTVLGTGHAAALENVPGRSCYRLGPDVVAVQPPLIERPQIMASVAIAQDMEPYELVLPNIELSESLLAEEEESVPDFDAALRRLLTVAGGKLDIYTLMETLSITRGQAALFQQRAAGATFESDGEGFRVVSHGSSFRIEPVKPSNPDNGRAPIAQRGLRYRTVANER